MQSGAPCSWMDTREVLVVKPSGPNQVDPDYLESEKRLQKWFSRQPAEIIVATGFIASTAENIPTTLKRDGSDFSAAIIGSLVRARQVTIWTDVDGVFSADPRKGLSCTILHMLSDNFLFHFNLLKLAIAYCANSTLRDNTCIFCWMRYNNVTNLLF